MSQGVLSSGKGPPWPIHPIRKPLPFFFGCSWTWPASGLKPISHIALPTATALVVFFQKSPSLNISITVSIMPIHLATFPLNCC